MVDINEMQKEFFEGSKLEVLLFSGAKFNSDFGPETGNMIGAYQSSKEMTQKPGTQIIGFIAGYDKERKEVLLSHMQPEQGRMPYVARIHQDCIYRVQKLLTVR
jgi:hypothetical protein